MIACLLFITATLAESTVVLFYVFNIERKGDEKPNENLLRKIDIGAAIVYAIAFIIFAIVYGIFMAKKQLQVQI